MKAYDYLQLRCQPFLGFFVQLSNVLQHLLSSWNVMVRVSFALQLVVASIFDHCEWSCRFRAPASSCNSVDSVSGCKYNGPNTDRVSSLLGLHVDQSRAQGFFTARYSSVSFDCFPCFSCFNSSRTLLLVRDFLACNALSTTSFPQQSRACRRSAPTRNIKVSQVHFIFLITHQLRQHHHH